MMNESWKHVWERKGNQNNKLLHQLDGWDHLTIEQWKEFQRRNFEPALKTLSHSNDILEIGCGSGAAIAVVKEMFPNVTLNGFDYSESLIKVCNENVEGNFWVSDIENENWGNQKVSYDFVFSVGTFIYLRNEEVARKCTEMMISLSSSGKVLIAEVSDKDRENIANNLRKVTHNVLNPLVNQKLDHLYLSKSFFEEIAAKNSCKVSFFDQKDICPFDWNLSSPYRYNVLLER